MIMGEMIQKFDAESLFNFLYHSKCISDEDDEAEEEECSDENSFQGDYNDGEEFGNQVDLFDVHFGIPSGNSEKNKNLTEADILPENFFQTSYLKVSIAKVLPYYL